MPHHAHAHARRRLNRPPVRRRGRLPANQFGGLVGTIDHLTLTPHDPHNQGRSPDDNHIYIWINVPSGKYAGLYECAFNTDSNQFRARTEYCVYEEQVALDDFPTVGFWEAEVSYRGLGLQQSDFEPITNGRLRSQLYAWADDCDLVVGYGVVYPQGHGMHEMHMNSGERLGSVHYGRTNEDGALAFYYRNGGDEPFRRWVFIKFSSQDL